MQAKDGEGPGNGLKGSLEVKRGEGRLWGKRRVKNGWVKGLRHSLSTGVLGDGREKGDLSGATSF